jgi:glycosyltransferase involved in cell wall biosynthesis
MTTLRSIDPARHVVLYIPDFSIGGAERVAINLAQALPSAEIRVTLLVNRRQGKLAGTIPTGVRVVSLEARRTILALPALIRFLRRERPDVLIASLAFNNLIAIWANRLAGRPTRLIASLHNTLSRERTRPEIQFRLLPLLYRLTLPLADGILTVSSGVADDLRLSIARLPAITTIHNPIVPTGLDALVADAPDHPWFQQAEGSPPVVIAVGRFVPQKNFALLLDAFAILSQTRMVRLAILGDGPLKPELVAQIDRLGLGDRVALLGTDANPWRYMARASVLALTSHFEGFGNVLVEAMAVGCPVVSTDCPHGPAEILEGGRWGRLAVPATPARFADMLAETLDHPADAAALHQRAACFSASAVAEDYRALIRRLLVAKPGARARKAKVLDRRSEA